MSPRPEAPARPAPPAAAGHEAAVPVDVPANSPWMTAVDSTPPAVGKGDTYGYRPVPTGSGPALTGVRPRPGAGAVLSGCTVCQDQPRSA